MTRFLVAAMAVQLVANGAGRPRPTPPPTEEAQVRAVPAGQLVEARLVDGARLRGWIGGVSDSGFVLRHDVNGQPAASQFRFDQVRSVVAVKPGRALRNVLIGVGVAAAAIGAAFGIFVGAHGLG